MPDDDSRDSGPPTAGPGSSRRRRWFLGGAAVLLVAAIWLARAVLMPFLLAIVVAYVLAPLVELGERVRVAGKHPPRWVVVLAVYVALIAALSGLVATAAPRLAGEFKRLTTEAPRIVAQVREQWLPELERRLQAASALYASDLGTEPAAQPTDDTASPEDGEATAAVAGEGGDVRDPGAKPEPSPTSSILVQPHPKGGYQVVLPPEGLRVVPMPDGGYRLHGDTGDPQEAQDMTAAITKAASRTIESTEQSALAVLGAAQKFAVALTRGVFGFVLMLMLSAYMLITTDRIFDFFRMLYPVGRRQGFDDLVSRMDRGLAGVVRGQLIICLVNGVLSGIGFYALGIKYWVFLTLVATTMSIIPIFGAIMSTVPAVVLALEQGVGVALLATGWIILIHQIEANLLNPKIMGDAARVHPVLVVFVLLAGEHVAGIAGALLAVPALSVAQTLFFFLRERSLGVPRTPSTPPPPMPAPEPTDAGTLEPATAAPQQSK